MSFVKQEYQKFGFNHTDENKFGQFESALWDLNYHIEEYYENNKKKVCIYEIPPEEELDALY
jgi:hypothetical protein